MFLLKCCCRYCYLLNTLTCTVCFSVWMGSRLFFQQRLGDPMTQKEIYFLFYSQYGEVTRKPIWLHFTASSSVFFSFLHLIWNFILICAERIALQNKVCIHSDFLCFSGALPSLVSVWYHSWQFSDLRSESLEVKWKQKRKRLLEIIALSKKNLSCLHVSCYQDLICQSQLVY